MPVTYARCKRCKGEISRNTDLNSGAEWGHVSFLDTVTDPHEAEPEEDSLMPDPSPSLPDDDPPTTVFPPIEVDDGLDHDQQDRVQALQAAGAVLRLHQETFTIQELLLVADWVLTGRQPS